MHHNSHQIVFLAAPILWEEWSDHFDGQNAAPLGSKTVICGSHTIKCCTWYRVSFINSICQVAILKWIWTSIMNLSQQKTFPTTSTVFFLSTCRALVSLLRHKKHDQLPILRLKMVAAGKWVNVMTLRIPKKKTNAATVGARQVSWNMLWASKTPLLKPLPFLLRSHGLVKNRCIDINNV